MIKFNWKDDGQNKSYFTDFDEAKTKKYVTVNGGLTESGYKMYLSLLAVIGKSSVYNSPVRKSYIWVESIEELKDMRLVIYNEITYEYVLTRKGNGLIKVLSKCLANQGVPKI